MGYIVVGSVLTGFGTGLSFVLWGEVYSQLKAKHLEHVAFVQLVIPGFCFVLANLPYQVNTVVMLLCPLFCTFGLLALHIINADKDLFNMEPNSMEISKLPFQIMLGVLIICFGYGFLQSHTTMQLDSNQINELSVYISYLVAACIALFILNRSNDPNFTNSLRFISSLLILGYLFFPLRQSELINLLSNIVINSGFFLLEYLIIIVCGSIAKYRNASPALIFASVRLTVSGSILVGMFTPLAFGWAFPNLLTGPIYNQIVAVVFVLILGIIDIESVSSHVEACM